MKLHPQEIAILKQWLAAGNPLGNHTYHHSDLDKMSARAYTSDIEKEDRLLESLAPFSPLIQKRRMFRYPFLNEGNSLAKRNAIRTYLSRNGYRVAQVTTDYYDWAWTDAFTRCSDKGDTKSIAWLKSHVVDSANIHLRDSNRIASRLFDRDIPQILLIHVGVFDALTLDGILRNWREQGVQFISLDDALVDPVYAFNPGATYENGRNFLEQTALARKISLDAFEDSTYSIERLAQICK
jgi:peptidoglycan/xylan/chitin deacetylase (PgdA/CDA1 family)